MNKWEISETTFYPVKPTEKGLIGFVSLVVNKGLVINSIAVYTKASGDGIRLLFADKQLINGKVITLVHPIDNELHEAMIDAVQEKLDSIRFNQ